MVKWLRFGFGPKYYIYRFDVIDGTERSPDIDNTNVVGYRFINQGNTPVTINAGLFIPSADQVSAAGFPLPGNDVDISTKVFPNEIDTTIYKIKFGAPPFGVARINKLTVISKCIAVKRPEQFVMMTQKEIEHN